MVRAVLFDVGSTLIRPFPSVAETMARVAVERGHAFSVDDFAAHMPAMETYYEAEYRRDGDFWCSQEGSTAIWLDQYRLVCRRMGLSRDAEGMARAVHEAYRRPEQWGIYPDVFACLDGLKERGFALGVVSNWDAGLEDLLRGLRLLPYFDAVAASAALGCRKPDPVIFETACTALGVPPSAAVHVGDRPDADGDGASAAGIRPVIVDRAGAEEGCGYDRVRGLAELLELL
ncbi:HAD family hydrolase [Gordonibacter sp. An230]|uniref:HAD family hydrolase n=1 Tax=Gordonibacter sp. An230 TaxID=1965592 RepID=UPI000B397272|nr:HAD-IA family hydrolase [Gordonibacter sp. An230]OUO90336.1 HAD family hydrolase [Gordonibacter sp. An230]